MTVECDYNTSVTDNFSGKKISKTGLTLIAISGGAAVALTVVCLPFVSPALRRICLPYVPATATQIKNVMCALAGRSGRLVDLGSGDGRIVFTAAQAGFVADGVELNPWLVAYCRLQAYRLGLEKYTRFFCQDLWKFKLQPYPNIVIFGVQEMMLDLEEKLSKEIQDNVHVVACRFPFPTWTPDATLGVGLDTVWLYKKPLKMKNNSKVQVRKQLN